MKMRDSRKLSRRHQNVAGFWGIMQIGSVIVLYEFAGLVVAGCIAVIAIGAYHSAQVRAKELFRAQLTMDSESWRQEITGEWEPTPEPETWREKAKDWIARWPVGAAIVIFYVVVTQVQSLA